MRSYLILGVAALALCAALPAAAQTAASHATPAGASAAPPATTDPATPPDNPAAKATGSTTASGAMPSSQPATTGSAADTSATIAAGLAVKDNTGATIGEITQVKPDASGKQTATIKMGADSFAVDASALVVQNGAAVINSTQAELQGMIKKATPATPATPPKKK